MADIQPYLQRMVERATEPRMQTTLKGFTRTLLVKFTDTGQDWLVRFNEGKEASFGQETLAAPDITVTTTTDVLAGVMDHKINGVTAYMQRKIQTRGAMDDLLKLQKVML